MNSTNDRSKKRARQALKCLPLSVTFYKEAGKRGLDAEDVYLKPEKYGKNTIRWFKNSNSIEQAFIWLIKVGVLRREVDGQGLTSKVRITPLYRQIMKDHPSLSSLKPSTLEIINHWVKRHWPR